MGNCRPLVPTTTRASGHTTGLRVPDPACQDPAAPCGRPFLHHRALRPLGGVFCAAAVLAPRPPCAPWRRQPPAAPPLAATFVRKRGTDPEFGTVARRENGLIALFRGGARGKTPGRFFQRVSREGLPPYQTPDLCHQSREMWLRAGRAGKRGPFRVCYAQWRLPKVSRVRVFHVKHTHGTRTSGRHTSGAHGRHTARLGGQRGAARARPARNEVWHVVRRGMRRGAA